MSSALDRKCRSEAFLRECGIPVNESLPPIVSENEANVKSAEKIMKRAVIALITSIIALKINEGEKIKQTVSLYALFLRAFELEEELTADEKKLLALENKIFPKKPPEDFLKAMIWRLERCMPLFWSCGLIDGDLDYPGGVSNEDLNGVSDFVSGCSSFGQIMSGVNLYSMSEILDNADQAYRMHSACREASARGEKPPAHIMADVIREQHLGFNWITGDYGRDNWDNMEEL